MIMYGFEYNYKMREPMPIINYVMQKGISISKKDRKLKVFL